MRIEPFAVEEWMNAWETGAKYNIAETCVDSVSIEELCKITGTDAAAFMKELAAKRLTYGDIEGSPAFREGVCGLYRSLKPEHIVPTHGAAGANHHVFISLISAGDRVVSVMPTYQQLYSIPESLGLAVPGVKMICINNPNNPTGALMDRETLLKIAEIADGISAWVLCDEVYRHLTQGDEWSESIADLYDKGISTGSMSKVFSLAGLRLGWIASRDGAAVRGFLSHRDYNLISCGMLDEAVAALALRGKDAVLSRNRGIVRGTGKGNLSPSSALTRAEAFTLNGVQVKGYAENIDARSGTSVRRIGAKHYSESQTSYYSDSQCQEMAQYLLEQKSTLLATTTIDSIPIYHMRENTLVTLERPEVSTAIDTYLVTGYSMPIGQTGSMSISAVQVYGGGK